MKRSPFGNTSAPLILVLPIHAARFEGEEELKTLSLDRTIHPVKDFDTALYILLCKWLSSQLDADMRDSNAASVFQGAHSTLSILAMFPLGL